MNTDDITDRQLESFQRFLKLLPHGKDLDLVILKAHLLIEEQLRQLISERLKNPTSLDDARLEFHQCILLAQALFQPDFQSWLWTSLVKLNKIRNAIAHNLKPKGLSDRIGDLIQSFPSGFAETASDQQTRFEFTLWSMFDAVSSLVEHPRAPVLRLQRISFAETWRGRCGQIPDHCRGRVRAHQHLPPTRLSGDQ